MPISSVEVTLFFISTKKRDLREGSTPEVHNTREILQRLLCICLENWTFPDSAILGADQKKRGL